MSKIKKIIYISPFLTNEWFGASFVSRCNLCLLKSQVSTVDISWANNPSSSVILSYAASKFMRALYSLIGIGAAMSPNTLIQLCKILKMHDKRSCVVWIDSSQLGICALLAKIYGFKVVVFFHNVEIKIIKMAQGPCYANLVRSIPIRLGEYLSARFSDLNIFLTEHDRIEAEKIYGVENSINIPPVLKRETIQFTSVTASSNLKVGFLGSDWFPNVLAVKFIAKLAVAHKNIEFIIAGGVSKRIDFSIPVNLKIVGYVENINEFYNSVDLIISPVTMGSGMKIKVLEAFRHNKIVFGSTHSLSGYEAYKDLIFYVADNLNDYSVLFNSFKGGDISENFFEKIPLTNEARVSEMVIKSMESLFKDDLHSPRHSAS